MLENKVAINQNKRIRGATKREFRKSSTQNLTAETLKVKDGKLTKSLLFFQKTCLMFLFLHRKFPLFIYAHILYSKLLFMIYLNKCFHHQTNVLNTFRFK